MSTTGRLSDCPSLCANSQPLAMTAEAPYGSRGRAWRPLLVSSSSERESIERSLPEFIAHHLRASPKGKSQWQSVGPFERNSPDPHNWPPSAGPTESRTLGLLIIGTSFKFAHFSSEIEFERPKLIDRSRLFPALLLSNRFGTCCTTSAIHRQLARWTASHCVAARPVPICPLGHTLGWP